MKGKKLTVWPDITIKDSVDNIPSDRTKYAHVFSEAHLEAPTSIIRTPKASTSRKSRVRHDGYGVQIRRHFKKHSISFKEAIEEIIIVENWKKYNIIDDENEGRCCRCRIY